MSYLPEDIKGGKDGEGDGWERRGKKEARVGLRSVMARDGRGREKMNE